MKSSFFFVTVPLFGSAPLSLAQNAPLARVTALQRVVERKVGAAPFAPAKRGDALNAGDVLRTGRRSKADLNFADGSLLRLGQLATVEMQSAKGTRITRGRALFSMLKPGRVVAGTAAAEIKGSVGIISILEDGAAEFSLYSGRMDVVTPRETVPVPPGSYVTIFADGTPSKVRTAPPLRFALGASLPSLLEEPSDVPFVGSRADQRSRETPERLAIDMSYYLTRNRAIRPFPDAQIGTGNPAKSGARDAITALLAAGGAALLARDGQREDAENHISEADPKLGRALDGDATLAVLGARRRADGDNGSSSIAGARLRGFYAQGPVFAEVALAPMRVRRADETRNLPGLISDASVTLRTRRGDLQLGRQRFLAGPTRATVIGSLARQGGRQIVDAATFRPRLGGGKSAQISYLNEAFIDQLPYEVGGRQRGLFARGALEKRGGNFGFNVLRYANMPVSTSLGATLDFALPLVRNEIEFYGEIGRDPFRRGLRTLGLAFPGLYERTGWETYLEYARLQKRDDARQPPSELALQLYKRLNRKMALAAGLSHLGDSTTLASLGLTLGTRTYFADGD